MHSFLPAGGGGVSTDLWAWVSARQDLRGAIAAVESAGAELRPLADAANWQSDGMRALHDLLLQLGDRTGSQVGDLSVREWELEAAVLA
ncbi:MULTISPECIES: hypothetical protein [unclassified Microbacterium]|uniref:hypothetical protein n=1 Tax=unclassified Microbacterium TaxID=2609290 RepID=UPI000EAA382E|nr:MULTISPECIES: hypothetical protein [unclassified Microbacterium]MBT2483921.1 hypothetical protein [Microbacterium sp. ISL-108]RKN66894.1 hypothetical protein D7252_04335 [Microbacterium sp. CGR2]